MNRISVLFAAGALGTAALTAGCSGGASKSATGGGSPLGSSTAVTSTSSSESVANPGAAASPSSSAGDSGTTSGAPSTPASASTSSHAQGGACTTAEMPSGIWKVIPDSQGAGHVAADLAFQNTSGHTCTVTGYPGVSLLASNDHPLPTNVLKDTSVAVTTIRVAPGAWVHSEMRYSPNIPGPGEPQNGQCEPTAVHSLALLPGDSSWAHVTLDNPTTVCEKGELQVKPFVSGKASPDGG